MKKGAFAVLLVAGVVLLTALGVWQLERREWKHDLIARVEERVGAPPMPAPALANTDNLEFDAAVWEYRPVAVRGRFLHDRETLVLAATRLGGGYWVMTPLQATPSGKVVLVNRGFVPTARRASRDWQRPAGEIEVTGLLRLSEPGGGFLRRNRPDEDRWYSRDVEEIVRVRAGAPYAPYFIDAAAGSSAGYPVGGLTVIRFNDNHLQYALTWFALALLLTVGAFRILRG